MQPAELERAIKRLCGNERGAATKFAELLGTTPASVCRWRKGLVPMGLNYEKHIKLLCKVSSQIDNLL